MDNQLLFQDLKYLFCDGTILARVIIKKSEISKNSTDVPLMDNSWMHLKLLGKLQAPYLYVLALLGKDGREISKTIGFLYPWGPEGSARM